LANLAVVLSAAYLKDVGRPSDQAESPAAEGCRVALEILQKLNAKPALIEAVGAIIGRDPDSMANQSIEFKVVADAERIVNLKRQQKQTPLTPDQLAARIEIEFLTEGGRKEARSVLIEGN
jgi:hypothetical protein